MSKTQQRTQLLLQQKLQGIHGAQKGERSNVSVVMNKGRKGHKGLHYWFEFAAESSEFVWFNSRDFICCDLSSPSWFYQTIAIGSPSEPRGHKL